MLILVGVSFPDKTIDCYPFLRLGYAWPLLQSNEAVVGKMPGLIATQCIVQTYDFAAGLQVKMH